MRKIFVLFGALAVVVLPACNRTVLEKKDVAEALNTDRDTVSWTLLPEKAIVPVPRGIVVSDSIIAVLGRYDNHWLHTYNKNTGRSVSSFLHEGQGPGDVVRGSVMDLVNESMAGIYDYGKMNLMKLNFPSCEIVRSVDLSGVSQVVGDAWVLSDEKALVKYIERTPENTITRVLAIVDLQTCKIATQYKGTPDGMENAMMLFSQPTLALSPDKKHFVTTTMEGGSIETFEIDNQGIQPVYSRVIHHLKYIEKGGMMVPENPIYVFVSSCASNEYFYTSYTNSEDANQATKLAVWDWQGRLLKCYETEKLIYKLAYDTSSDTIYGIVEDEEGPALARLNLTTDHN